MEEGRVSVELRSRASLTSLAAPGPERSAQDNGVTAWLCDDQRQTAVMAVFAVTRQCSQPHFVCRG